MPSLWGCAFCVGSQQFFQILNSDTHTHKHRYRHMHRYRHTLTDTEITETHAVTYAQSLEPSLNFSHRLMCPSNPLSPALPIHPVLWGWGPLISCRTPASSSFLHPHSMFRPSHPQGPHPSVQVRVLPASATHCPRPAPAQALGLRLCQLTRLSPGRGCSRDLGRSTDLVHGASLTQAPWAGWRPQPLPLSAHSAECWWHLLQEQTEDRVVGTGTQSSPATCPRLPLCPEHSTLQLDSKRALDLEVAEAAAGFQVHRRGLFCLLSPPSAHISALWPALLALWLKPIGDGVQQPAARPGVQEPGWPNSQG